MNETRFASFCADVYLEYLADLPSKLDEKYVADVEPGALYLSALAGRRQAASSPKRMTIAGAAGAALAGGSRKQLLNMCVDSPLYFRARRVGTPACTCSLLYAPLCAVTVA